ncbi:outer membrane protein assembly factor BamD [Halieaceae bacterium IMCC14734]|uniref:Outer membrane protein assembly factor BamD n=1 Tax=Candidatus Litorirhabdus singularis TaxID=2518993 RepID=A0ABT3TLJ1_9GAMM|nr:outer membrane protein assembly factor BamD [Candidatus Litorirhabdus singularis]MCX2983199.1 outer membrane protein assembly factor BamD [Candidatus Litorirhabdus singularis]
MPQLKILIFGLLALLLTACSSNDELNLPPGASSSEAELYQTAQRYLRGGNYELAVQSLQLLESRFPFGRYAEQAQLELIYAHYNNYEHEAAIEAANRFIRLHPQHPNVDYAFYMKGLASYTLDQGFLDRFIPSDKTKRDTGHARTSFAEFAQLLARYPDSSYAADAKARMVHLRNLLARNEINIANYYFKRGAYLAATNRGRFVVENFQQTPAVADGLAVMVQGYTLMGLSELADNSLAVLALNYPEHSSLDDNGNFISNYTAEGPQRSIINRLTLGLVSQPKPPEFDNRPEDAGY